VSRLPIRARLTLGYALAMALALGATAGILYLRFESSLNHSIDQTLSARATALRLVIASAPERQWPDLLRDQTEVGQVLDRRGRILATTRAARQEALLGPRRAARAARADRRKVLATVGRRPGLGHATRVLGISVPRHEAVLAVGTPLRARADANESFSRAILLAAPVALALAAALGYALAAGALRPVEVMRRRAAAISRLEPGTRLPEPEADDEIRRLGATLNEMLARLEQAAESERRFVADASHELRTPIAILRSELDLALRRDRSPEELKGALRSTREQVERLGRLADDLLVIARADQGRLPVRPEPLDARELLEHVAERHGRRAAAAGRHVRVEGGGGTVPADALRLEQAVGNLTENALRHGTGEIVLRGEADDGHVALHVEDDGPGFPPGFTPEQAFERFARAPGARAREGAGLGLAIVRAIAEAHGGTAGVENRPGGGADVWIRLPSGRG
jgi:two-component system OmpR family sensor kinase